MRNEMVGRVAKAIGDNLKAALPDGAVLDYEYAALAAIEAMRQPTHRMVSALCDIWASDDRDKQALQYGIGFTAYRAMIDAAASPIERPGNDTPIEMTEITVGAWNALKDAGFTTVGEVRAVSDSELLRKPSIGRKRLAEIRREIG